MKRALAVLALLSCVGACVTGAGIVRKDRVSLPVLLGAIAADLILTPIVVGNATSTSTNGSIILGLGLTAVDLGAGCAIGACGALRP